MKKLSRHVQQFWSGSRVDAPNIPVINISDQQTAIRINVQPSLPPTQRESNTSHVINVSDVENEEAHSTEAEKENFIRNFLRVMRFTGMSCYNPFKGNGIPRKWLKIFTNILLKTTFWAVAVFAFMSICLDAKYYWLHFLDNGGLMKFVNFGFHVINILVQVFLLRLFTFLHDGITSMIEKLDELLAFGMDPKEREQEKRENRMLAALVITTILKCMLKAGIDKAIINWSITDTIDERSKFLYHDINIWKMGDLANKNVTNHLDMEFSKMDSTAWLSMGVLQIMMKFCSEMKLETAVDLVIVVGACLLKYTRRLKKRVANDNHDHNGNDSAIMESPTGNWAYYEKLAAANKAINLIMEGLLKMIHAYNGMTFAYFLMEMLENNATILEFLYLLYSCGKVSFAYFIAKQTNGYNSDFQEWMINWGLRSTEPGFAQKAILALKKMKVLLLGLGSGEFIIGESFMLKFGGMVGSMFMLQVDKADGY